MNQTLWIILGGVAVVGIAIGLYAWSGSSRTISVTNVEPAQQTSAAVAADPVIPTTKTTPLPPKAATETTQQPAAATTPEADPVVVLHTSMGDITLKLYAKEAPKAVDSFLKLAGTGFYDGVKFHRVIQGFMIQSGDPLSKDDAQMVRWGTGGPGYQFENESTGHRFVRGSLGMANSGGTASNGSQFFIVTAASTPFLDGGYTNFGEVVSGLDVAMQIEAVKTDGSAQMGTGNDRPLAPVVIKSVEVR